MLIECDSPSQVWPIWPNVTHFAQCLLVPSATILISVTHVYRVWLTFPSLTHLAKCDPFCAVWLVPPSAPILITVTHIYRVWLTFPSLTHLAKCDPFCPAWLVLPSATILITLTQFIRCDSPVQIWPIWPNVTHFAQWKSYFQVRQFR